jgi:hypothetical protein
MDVYEETRIEKLKRKCREEPFVPAGSWNDRNEQKIMT